MKKCILFLFVLFSFQLLYATNDRDQKETAPPISQPVTNVFLSNVVLTNPYVGTNNEDDESGTETAETTDPRDGKPNSISATPTDLSSDLNTVRDLGNTTISVNNTTTVAENTTANSATGIEMATLATFGAYPNPVANELQVHLSLTEETQLYLLNTMGQIVYVVSYPAYADYVQISVGDLPNGMYLLVAETPQQRITQKIQVIH
jgi:hypothetical protein